jgi:hypothetical protein
MSDEHNIALSVPAREDSMIVVEGQPSHCLSCLCQFLNYNSMPIHIVLDSIERSDDAWNARGYAVCPDCGMAIEFIRNEIPIVADTFKCPRCDTKDQIEYLIDRIDRSRDGAPGFEFEARIQCKTCHKKRSFKKFVTNIVSSIKIEITPDGIGIKKE